MTFWLLECPGFWVKILLESHGKWSWNETIRHASRNTSLMSLKLKIHGSSNNSLRINWPFTLVFGVARSSRNWANLISPFKTVANNSEYIALNTDLQTKYTPGGTKGREFTTLGRIQNGQQVKAVSRLLARTEYFNELYSAADQKKVHGLLAFLLAIIPLHMAYAEIIRSGKLVQALQ